MIKISAEQLEYLSPLIPNINELIDKDTDEDILLAIDDLIVGEFDEEQNWLSSQGLQLQKIYDEIFKANE